MVAAPQEIRERVSRPARAILSEFIRAKIDEQDEVSFPDLVRDAYREFSTDSEFVDAIVQDGISLIVPELARDLLSRNRKYIGTASGGVRADKLEERTKDRVARIFEHVGEGRHVSLLAMTKPQLRWAIDERKQRIAGELRAIKFLAAIEKQMPDDRTTVGERFSDQQFELLSKTRQHLIEMGVELPEEATFEEITSATDALAGEIKTQGFKRDADNRPVFEARQLKAGIKESVNVLFAGEKWGKRPGYAGKGPKNFTAERAFVKPDMVTVAPEITGVDLFIGHLKGPNGPTSTIGYAEYIDQPSMTFYVLTAKGSADLVDKWPEVWTHMEFNGLGAMRSQGFGQFEVIGWDPVDVADVPMRSGEVAELEALAVA